ncbi:MAG: nucleotidyl transferase AbiEii/AbiGii toxin family protein [Rhodomicrobium sp.]|nr:nucleotidyl transferase AbiEii/AbiGii toxin family protein [Rhodomicrobium sp.]
MATPSRETLQRLADETGHQSGTLEKVARLLDILREVSSDRVLAAKLVLKGGTALNVFHLSLDRLSVDIDLNYIGALDRPAMEKERPEIEAALNRILASQGYAVRRQPDDHAGGKWLARYSSALGGSGTLELDVNYTMRQPLFGATRMRSAALGGVQANDVLVLGLQEIIAGKLVALFDRNAARDLFDARRILSLEGLDWAAIKAGFLAFGACARRDWRTVSIDAIKGDPRELRQKLLICLPRGYFGGGRAVESWIDETVALCRERLAFLFDWTAEEKEFFDNLLDRGEVNAHLLAAPPEVRERIAAMPMLAWKRQNVRKFRGLDS